MPRCTAYHLGGKRFALMCIRAEDTTVEAFRGALQLPATHQMLVDTRL